MSSSGVERTRLRDRMVGGLRPSDEGARLRLTGWVHRRRDLGGLVFIDLRDRAGLVQLSCNPDWTPPAVMERESEGRNGLPGTRARSTTRTFDSRVACRREVTSVSDCLRSSSSSSWRLVAISICKLV